MLQQSMLYILTFISGLFFGSFLNLVSDRLPKKQSILFGRSRCDFCKKTLKANNLIPVVSYLLQKGRCSFCHKKLSIYYPLSEILTGLVFVGSAYYSRVFLEVGFNATATFIFLLIMSGIYVILIMTDLKTNILPDKIVIPAILFVFAYLVFNTFIYYFVYYRQLKGDSFGVYLLQAGYLKMQILDSMKSLGVMLISSAGISLFFALLVFVTKGRGMGGGDIKLGFLIGLFNGFPNNILAIFLGFVFGAVVSMVLVILKKRTMKDTVPFGPFLIAGSIVTLQWGSQLWNFYINLF